jgi:putative phosphoesterase
MRILVLSDSHGDLSNMERAVEASAPRMILHLGDCWQDGQKLHQSYPDIPLMQVPGNCDYRPSEPAEQLLFLEEFRVLMCHGHTYGVKESLISAGFAAQEQNLDLFLFGHTHRAMFDQRGKTVFLNPGSIRDGTYALVRIENGKLRTELQRLP